MRRSIIKIKQNQQLLVIVLFCLSGLLVFYLVNPFGKEETPKKKEVSSADVPFFTDDPKELLIGRLMADVESLSEEKKALQNSVGHQNREIGNLKDKLDALAESVVVERSQSSLDGKKALQMITEMQEHCSKEITQLQTVIPIQESYFREEVIPSNDDYQDEEEPSSPWTIDLLTDRSREGCEELTIHNGVIAGTTVKAILENGITASFHPNSAENPVFVKLRIMDNTILPKGLKTQMKDAYLIGSAYGDLSTERVRVRVEKLIVFKKDGTSQETQVVGVVTDEHGQTGLSGKIVDRSPEILKGAAIAGVLDGGANFLSATVNSQNLASSTKGLPSNFRFDLLKEGCASGGSRAMERIADYYAYLLENYHPYIMIYSGRLVDVTFLATSRYGSTEVNLECAQIREKSKRFAAGKKNPSISKESIVKEDSKESSSASEVLRAYGL